VIEQWRDERLAAGAGAQSIRKLLALLKTMLDRALRDETIKSNPANLVKKPSGKRRATP
jgi:site-specific recombinase XerC